MLQAGDSREILAGNYVSWLVDKVQVKCLGVNDI